LRLLQFAEEDSRVQCNSYEVRGNIDDEFSKYDVFANGFPFQLETLNHTSRTNLKMSYFELKKMFTKRLDALRFLYKNYYISSGSSRKFKLRSKRIPTDIIEQIFECQEREVNENIDKDFKPELVFPQEGYIVINLIVIVRNQWE
jgi:hypothetical protein